MQTEEVEPLRLARLVEVDRYADYDPVLVPVHENPQHRFHYARIQEDLGDAPWEREPIYHPYEVIRDPYGRPFEEPFEHYQHSTFTEEV